MIQDFFSAISAYSRAFRKISDLRLWGYFLIPGLISLLIGTGIYFAANGLALRFEAWIIQWYPWEWGKNIIETASYWVSIIFIWGGSLIIFKHLVMVLASPFMSPLSQRIEKDMLGSQTVYEGFSMTRAIKEMMRGLTIAIRNIIRELFYTFLLMIISLFIPVIGPILSVLIFLIQAYYAGFGNMDYTLERHYGVRGSANFVKKRRGTALGNGVVFLGLVFTGIGVLIAPPLATVAATLETVPRLKRLDTPKNDFV